MPEIDNTPMTGPQWAAHHVTVWLENDSHLYPVARRFAYGDEYEYGDTEFMEWVADLLYDPRYGRDLPDFAWVTSWDGDANAARNVRESFTREDFDAIDWAVVRDSLLAE